MEVSLLSGNSVNLFKLLLCRQLGYLCIVCLKIDGNYGYLLHFWYTVELKLS